MYSLDEWPKRRNMDLRFGTWNMYKAGSLVRISEELSKYKLDLVEVQEVRWEGDRIELSREYKSFYIEKPMRIMK
jgi:hypothetical protein